jgi:transcriptional regulator with XRE-family HTH domain
MPKLHTADHLGAKLAKAIAEKGVTQKDVAAEFKVKPPTVSGDWIKHGRIGKRQIPHLVRYFERPYEWWFDDGATTPRGTPRGFAAGLARRFRDAMQRVGYQKPDHTMNVSALAKDAGCSPSTIMTCLDDDRAPTYIDVLVALQLCDALSISPYWLLWNQGSREDVPVKTLPMQSLRGKTPPRRRQLEEIS